MQNYCKTIGALAAASALVAGTASAEIDYSINGGYHNEYLFRGLDFGGNMTTVGVDASTEAYGLGLSAGLWYADYQTSSNAWFGIPFDKYNTNELDLYGEVSKELWYGITGAVGYIAYITDDNAPAGFPPGFNHDDAQEIYFGLSRDIGYGIAASLTYYWDIETDNDGYTELGLSKSIELTDCVSLGLGTALGYTMEEDDFANLMTTVTVDWAFAETATLSPYIMYVVDGESSSYETTNENEFIGGVNLTVSF